MFMCLAKKKYIKYQINTKPNNPTFTEKHFDNVYSHEFYPVQMKIKKAQIIDTFLCKISSVSIYTKEMLSI